MTNIKNNRRHIETCRLTVHMSTIYMKQYTNLTFAHHLSLCSSMVRASHRRSEGYGFDSRQGLRKFFWENSLRACVLSVCMYVCIYVCIIVPWSVLCNKHLNARPVSGLQSILRDFEDTMVMLEFTLSHLAGFSMVFLCRLLLKLTGFNFNRVNENYIKVFEEQKFYLLQGPWSGVWRERGLGKNV